MRSYTDTKLREWLIHWTHGRLVIFHWLIPSLTLCFFKMRIAIVYPLLAGLRFNWQWGWKLWIHKQICSFIRYLNIYMYMIKKILAGFWFKDVGKWINLKSGTHGELERWDAGWLMMLKNGKVHQLQAIGGEVDQSVKKWACIGPASSRAVSSSHAGERRQKQTPACVHFVLGDNKMLVLLLTGLRFQF